MKRLSMIMFGCVSCLIFFSGCSAFKALHASYADYHGDVESNYMVQDARNRILSYDWFYDQKGQIDAQIANINSLAPNVSERDGMVRVVNSMIGDYNSRSHQYNHNMWKASDLPYEMEFYKGEF